MSGSRKRQFGTELYEDDMSDVSPHKYSFLQSSYQQPPSSAMMAQSHQMIYGTIKQDKLDMSNHLDMETPEQPSLILSRLDKMLVCIDNLEQQVRRLQYATERLEKQVNDLQTHALYGNL
jgi:hypothetical protein